MCEITVFQMSTQVAFCPVNCDFLAHLKWLHFFKIRFTCCWYKRTHGVVTGIVNIFSTDSYIELLECSRTDFCIAESDFLDKKVNRITINGAKQ